jgi:hypothetical protein
MTTIGPFWRRKPTTFTVWEEWAWCMLWLDDRGYVVAIEWDR